MNRSAPRATSPSRRTPAPRPWIRGRAWLLALALLLAAPPARAHEALGPAIATLSKQIAAEPANALLLLRRAELYREARDFESAEDDLHRAAFLAPELADVALASAQLALDRDDPHGALATLDAAPHGGDSGRRWVLRARALVALGHHSEAIHAWNEALEDLAQPEPDDYLERARLVVAADRMVEARAGLEQGIARIGPALSLVHALATLAPDEALDELPVVPFPSLLAPAAESLTGAPAEARFTPLAGGALAVVDLSASRKPGLRARFTAANPAVDAVTVSRGPYLQRCSPSEVTVRWRTAATGNGRVWYGTAPNSYLGYVDDPAVATEHGVRLTGLAAATRYWYTVGSTTETALGGDSLTFKTHPVAGTVVPVRIWAIGDSGIPGSSQNRVRDRFVAWTGARGCDVWLMLGDNAYGSGLDTEYQSGLFTPYRAQLQKWPLWPTRGNHDFVYSGADNDYYDHFVLPAAAEAGGTVSGSEAYYSFDYGPVHFICLDSEGTSRVPGSAMLTWLAGDLAANTRPWTVVYFHHPPYTKGSHDSDDFADSAGRMRDMRQNVLPILDAAGVDLVLSGHSHSYERSYLLNGHYDESSTLTPAMKKGAGDGRPNGDGAYVKPSPGAGPYEGAVYAVDGSAAQTTTGSLTHPAMVSSLLELGSMVIDIDGDRLDARFINDSGVIRDSFAIVKGAATAVGGSASTEELSLGPALPNPFRSEVALAYRMAAAGPVRLDIFDPAGRRVATLVDGVREAGRHAAHWNGTDARGRQVPAGMYVASLEAGGRRLTRRIAFVR